MFTVTTMDCSVFYCNLTYVFEKDKPRATQHFRIQNKEAEPEDCLLHGNKEVK